MKEEVIEMYREGMTIKEIAEATNLASSSVGQYIYASKENHNPITQEVQMRTRIKKMIEIYEEKFGKF